VFYKFQFDPKRTCKVSDIGVIGMLTYKLDKESFWVTPTLFECQNHLQGQLFDEMCDENTNLLSDMQEKAMRFMRDEEQVNSSSDFQFFLKRQNQVQGLEVVSLF